MVSRSLAGRSIQEVGIQPDLVVQRSDASGNGLPSRRRVREKDLQGHFTQQDATDLEGGNAPPTRILEHEQAAEDEAPPATDDGVEVEEEESVDVQLARAVEVLKSWTYFEDLRKMREERGGEAADGATVAAAEAAEAP